MKAKRVFLTVGLSLAMAGSLAAAGILGVAKELNQAKADVSRTVYCAIDTTTLGSYTLKVNANIGDSNTWKQADMVDLNDTTSYPGKKVFSGTFDEKYGGVDAMQFQLYDGSTWKAQDQVISSWTTSGTYADKLHIYGGAANSWETYSAVPTHDYYYSINGGADVKMVDHENSEVKSPSAVTLAAGDILTFKEDSDDYAVGGKRNTKVYNQSTYQLKALEAFTETLYLDHSTGELWAGLYSISDGYYVAGSMTNWVDTRFLIPMTEDNGVYTSSTFSAALNDEFKIVKVIDNAVADSDWLGIKNHKVYTTTSAAVEYNTTSTNAKITDAGQYYVKFTASEIASGSVPYLVEDANFVPDIPDEEGYYICGNFSSVPSWTYSGATKMTNTTGENVAYEMNFNLAVGDELRVRSYFTDRPNGQAADQWATLGDNGYADPENGWGVKSGDNFKATKAGYYDVYAKYVGEDFMFYVAPHVETYEISLTAKLYEGRNLVETRNLSSQLAYDGSDFNPAIDAISGYVGYGVYTDASCSTEYEPTKFNAAGQLYIKYMRTGYYVVGDADFTGSNIGAWDAAGGVRLTTEVNDPQNFLEGAITIPDVEGAVQCRPLELTAEKEINWLDFTLGTTYSFAEKNGNNLEFSKGGTYAVYVKIVDNVPVVYLNEGLAAFNTKFLNEVGGVCSEILGGTKTLDQLKAIWLEQKAAYQSLSAEEKDIVVAKTINGGNENGSDLEKVIAKYSYIVHKYGTANCEDFIWGQTYAAQSNGFNPINNNNAMIIMAVAISVVAISAVGLFFIIRRKRLVK